MAAMLAAAVAEAAGGPGLALARSFGIVCELHLQSRPMARKAVDGLEGEDGLLGCGEPHEAISLARNGLHRQNVTALLEQLLQEIVRGLRRQLPHIDVGRGRRV